MEKVENQIKSRQTKTIEYYDKQRKKLGATQV